MKKFTGIGAFVLLFSSYGLAASASCGNIIAPENIYDVDSAVISTPITDCENPFGVTDDTYPYTASIAGTSLTSNSVISIPTEGTQDYIASPGFPVFNFINIYYRHTDDGYEAVAITDVFSQQIEEKPLLLPGTYTLVSEEILIFLTENNKTWYERVVEYIIPPAYAQFPPNPKYAITFTLVAEEIEEPQGASSVLFLPGIMGSRLYETGNICGEDGEVELWVSTNDCKQLRLKTRFDGVDINGIYTKNTTSAVIDSVSILKLYSSFIEGMDSLQQNNIIADFKPLAYDWRFRLDDLLKLKSDPQTGNVFYDPTVNFNESYLYQTVKELVENSYSGNLTIVAHSNGGLLAKAFLERLESTNDPLKEKIDNLILIAVPQAGTPDSLVGVLHGTGIGLFDSVVSQKTSRQILNTAPFAHHLLPSNTYFATTNDNTSAVITIEGGDITTVWEQQFGSRIDSQETMQTFLHQNSGRPKPEVADLLQPEVVDGFLLNYANTIHTSLDTWEPEAFTTVYQIAGIGIETPYQITYSTGQKCAERSLLQVFRCIRYEPVLKYNVGMTSYGDGTVIGESALVMDEVSQNVQKLWLDLFEQNDKELINRVHKDIFEVSDIFNFVYNTILATSSLPYNYLTDIPPAALNDRRFSFTLHSPLDLYVINQDNEVVSSSTSTIDGVVYRRFGEIQYISLPATTDEVTVMMEGVSTGSFTLDTSLYAGSEVLEAQSYRAIPSGTSTIASLIISDGNITDGIVEVDYDGDGVPEITYDVAGEIIDEITYETLLKNIDDLTFRRDSHKKVLIITAQLAKFYREKSVNNKKFKKLELATLMILKKQVLLYERSRLLSKSDSDELIKIIEKLINDIL